MKSVFAYLSITTTMIFGVVVVALLFLATDIDPMRSGISFYALTRYSFIISAALALVGISGISLAFGLWSTIFSVAGRIGLALLIVWGITSIVAGIFPLDAPGAVPTLSGSIHNMAGLNFLLIVPAVLLIELPRSSRVDHAQAQPITHSLAWLVLVSAILLFTFNGPLASISIGGFIQRLYWLVITLWIVFKSQDILRAERKDSVP